MFSMVVIHSHWVQVPLLAYTVLDQTGLPDGILQIEGSWLSSTCALQHSRFKFIDRSPPSHVSSNFCLARHTAHP